MLMGLALAGGSCLTMNDGGKEGWVTSYRGTYLMVSLLFLLLSPPPSPAIASLIQ